jgi:hypothetical protein
MKSSISRSAAWLHYAEENPDEVLAALDDKTEAVIRVARATGMAISTVRKGRDEAR